MKILLMILLCFLVPLAFISLIIASIVEVPFVLSGKLFLEDYAIWLDRWLGNLINKATPIS